MENYRDAKYSENMSTSGKPYEDLTGSADSGQNLSFFKDDEAKAWERKLLAPDMGLDAAALQMSKETRSFLWKAGMVPYVSASQFTGEHPEDPSAEVDRERSSFSQVSSSSTFTGSGFARTSSSSDRSESRSSRPSASHASNRTSRRSAAWDILSGSGPTSYADTANSGSRSGRENRRTRFVQKTGSKHAGASPGPKKATSTYETVRKTMQAKPALRRKSLFLVLFLTIAVSILITAGTFFFIRKSMPGSDIIPPEPPIFIGGDENGKENAGSNVLADYGNDYSDFYTPKYIASYELPGDDAQYNELCVIDPKSLFGTSEQPADERKRLFFSTVYPTWITLGYMNTDSYQDLGYTIMYADPGSANPYGMPDILLPPQLADQGKFFEAVIRGFTDPDSDSKDNYRGCRIGKIQMDSIGSHHVTYLTVTYKDSIGREILDVYSFEQKPLGSAFITVCRCESGEVADGKEALSDLYEMLTFHTEDFESIDASSRLFTKARVYSSHNSYSAVIDVSDLGDLKYSRNFYRNLANFGIGEYVSYGDPMLQIDLNYLAYSSVEDLGGYENWIDNALEVENDRVNYAEPAEETGRAWFTFEDNTVYFVSMAGSGKLNGSIEDVALFMYRIETPDGEIALDLRFEHEIPEIRDPEEFLKEHISLEAMK
ncbi:MAG: hypothetical protein K6G34_08855 [Lachnospiraceae bacterium]|nr:hypothetical protein [Lachnospiraceae bacterium]